MPNIVHDFTIAIEKMTYSSLRVVPGRMTLTGQWNEVVFFTAIAWKQLDKPLTKRGTQKEYFSVLTYSVRLLKKSKRSHTDVLRGLR